MYRLARHQNTAEHEQANDGVEFEHRVLGPGPQRQVLQDPALAHPVRHQPGDSQRGRDGRAFKVLALPRGVLGYIGHRDVEARQARQAAEHKERQEEVVDGGAQAQRKRGGRRRDAK